MEKLSVLLVTGVVTMEHRWRQTNQQLLQLLESTGRFHVRVTEDFRGCTDETLANYDVVFLNYDGKEAITAPYQRWGETAENALLHFVSRGGGVVFYHSSICLDSALPEEFMRLCGTYIPAAKGRRYPSDQFVMTLSDEAHPITQGLPKETFLINDDFLAGAVTSPGAEVQVLATVFDDLETYRRSPNFPPAHQPVEIPDGDLSKMPGVNQNQPVCWINHYGQGRVFVFTLGHAMETLGRVPYMTMLVRGTEWAATGQVTLNPPDRSGERRLRPWPYYG